MMTGMTFVSPALTPRRTAVRRAARPSPKPLTAASTAAVSPVRAGSDRNASLNKAGLILLTAGAVALHAAIYIAVGRGGPVQRATPPRPPELQIDLAPPPPPAPPKPLQQVARPVAAPVRPAPSLPVVRSDAVDNTPSPDAVQVATAPQPAPAPPAVGKITEPRGYAGYLSNPAPVYPVTAQDKGQEGQVLLNVHVLASGQPDTINVARSSGYRILDDSAMKAVAAWAFDPARRGATPVDGWVRVPITFKLS